MQTAVSTSHLLALGMGQRNMAWLEEAEILEFEVRPWELRVKVEPLVAADCLGEERLLVSKFLCPA